MTCSTYGSSWGQGPGSDPGIIPDLGEPPPGPRASRKEARKNARDLLRRLETDVGPIPGAPESGELVGKISLHEDATEGLERISVERSDQILLEPLHVELQEIDPPPRHPGPP